MGEVEVENPKPDYRGDGKLYKNKNLKLKCEKEEEKTLLLKIQNKEESFEHFSPIWLKIVIQASAGSEINYFKKLRNGSILIKTKNTQQAKNLVQLVNIVGLYEVRVTECDEPIEEKHDEKGKLRDSTSRQELASAISMMTGEDLRAPVEDSKNTRKFQEKFISSLLNARQRRGKVGTYFLTFVKAEPPDVNAKNRW
jgi:hypothetical protein